MRDLLFGRGIVLALLKEGVAILLAWTGAALSKGRGVLILPEVSFPNQPQWCLLVSWEASRQVCDHR